MLRRNHIPEPAKISMHLHGIRNAEQAAIESQVNGFIQGRGVIKEFAPEVMATKGAGVEPFRIKSHALEAAQCN